MCYGPDAEIGLIVYKTVHLQIGLDLSTQVYSGPFPLSSSTISNISYPTPKMRQGVGAEWGGRKREYMCLWVQ